MNTYRHPDDLRRDYRRLAGGTVLRDADGDTFVVPHRALQRVLGPEQTLILVADGRVFYAADVTYPVDRRDPLVTQKEADYGLAA